MFWEQMIRLGKKDVCIFIKRKREELKGVYIRVKKEINEQL